MLRRWAFPALVVVGVVIVGLMLFTHSKAKLTQLTLPSEPASPSQATPPLATPDREEEEARKEEPAPKPSPAAPADEPKAQKPPDTQQVDERALEDAVGRLRKGNLAYHTPEKMKTGETSRVIARIGSNKVSLDALVSGMPSDKGTKTEAVETPVSTKMKMTLKSADFDITSLSSEQQFVLGDSPTTWAWDIAPKHSGKLRLHLAAVVELGGLSKDFTTVDREIKVQVDPVDAVTTFVKANTVWVLGTLGAGIVAVWGWLKRPKKQKPPPPWENP